MERCDDIYYLFAELVVRYGVSVADAKELLFDKDELLIYDRYMRDMFEEQFKLKVQAYVTPTATLTAMTYNMNKTEDARPHSNIDFLPITERQRLNIEANEEAEAEKTWINYFKRNAGSTQK